MTMKLVREIAISVRSWIETLQKELEATTYFTEDLCGMCAIATTKLALEFSKMGINFKIIESTLDTGGTHCFTVVTIDNVEYIVDVTATQFQYQLNRKECSNLLGLTLLEKVEIKNKVSVNSYDFWKTESRLDTTYHEFMCDVKVFDTIKEFKTYLNKHWPEEQRPLFIQKNSNFELSFNHLRR